MCRRLRVVCRLFCLQVERTPVNSGDTPSSEPAGRDSERWGKANAMKRILSVAGFLLVASSAPAERITELNGRHVQLYPTKHQGVGVGRTKNLNVSYHNGPVIHQGKVDSILWVPAPTV